MQQIPIQVYDLDLLQITLGTEKHGLFINSLILLRETLNVLNTNQKLNDWDFSYKIGLIIPEDKIIMKCNENELDILACRGIRSIDKRRPIMEYVYIKSQCPFCLQPAKINEFISVQIFFDLPRSGLTFQPIKQGEIAVVHRNV